MFNWTEIRALMAAEINDTHPDVAAAILLMDADKPIVAQLRTAFATPQRPHLRIVK